MSQYRRSRVIMTVWCFLVCFSLSFPFVCAHLLRQIQESIAQGDIQRIENIFQSLQHSANTSAEDWFNFGLLLHESHLNDISLRVCDHCITTHPSSPLCWLLKGSINYQLGNADHALQLLNVAESKDPANPTIKYKKASVLLILGQLDEAAKEFSKCIDLSDLFAPQSHLSLGWISSFKNHYYLALYHYQSGFKYSTLRRIDRVQLLFSLSEVDDRIGDIDMALKYLNKAKLIISEASSSDDDWPDLRIESIRIDGGILNIHQFILNWSVIEMYRMGHDLAAQIKYFVDSWESIDKSLFSDRSNYRYSIPVPIFQTLFFSMPPPFRRRVTEYFCLRWMIHQPLKTLEQNAFNKRKLNIGYVSHDFKKHPTSQLIIGLLHLHNRNHFKVFAFNYGPNDNSKWAQQSRSYVDEFVDIASLGFYESAFKIQSSGIDIVVDLQSHTFKNRFEMFVYRPAPICISFLAYPGTTGASFVDYFVGDRIVSPPEHSNHYTEKLILLPPPYQVNTFDESTPFPTRHHIHVDKNWMWKDHLSQLDNYLKRSILFGDSDVGINGPFVFCNFNNAHKLDPGSFSIWMNILRRVPDSVLWILVDQFDERAKYIMKNLHKEAIFHGIAPSRILTASKMDHSDHIQRIRRADLFLDTFVYGAHTTAADSLRAGLPILTIRGESFASRVAASLLYSAGLEYLICDSLKELEDMSVYLANHREILSRIRFELEKLVGYDSNTLSQTNESDRACERTFGRTFDTNCFRFHWEHSLHLVWELKAMERNVDESSKFHVVV